MHIYTTNKQPATGWTDMHSGEPIQMGWPPEKLIYAHCCGKKRPAKNLVVQSYYDCTMIWCAEGHGCKHPQAVANKRRREHRNRSLAQQARRAREKTPNVELTGAGTASAGLPGYTSLP